jgi:hypothetical protein
MITPNAPSPANPRVRGGRVRSARSGGLRVSGEGGTAATGRCG